MHIDLFDALLKKARRTVVVRRGTQMSNHKLNDYEVRTIRSLYPSHSLGTLSRMYGISKTQAYRIVRGLKWRHVQ